MSLQDLNNLEEEVLKAEENPKQFFYNEHVLKECQKLCHPDKHKDKVKAEELFKRFAFAYEQSIKPPVVVKWQSVEYELEGEPIVGDTSDVYFGRKIVKVGRFGVDFVQNEASALKDLYATKYSLYFPLLLDTHKQVNVFEHTPGFRPLTKVSFVDDRHIVWIYKRLLTAIGAAHREGITHGGVIPSNVIIFPHNHGLKLLDWKFARKKEVKKSKAFVKYYPPDEKVTAETDIYMATQCVANITLVPKQMTAFFNSCLLEKQSMRPNDAFSLVDEFTELAFKLYGKSQFVEMK